jgi:hypothetical protein
VTGIIGAVRNAALVFLAPRPVVVRALFPRWSLVIIRASAARKTATLFLEPAPSRELLPPVTEIEKNKTHQNSFFLHLDGPGWPGWAVTNESAIAITKIVTTKRMIIDILNVDRWLVVL